MKFERMRPTMNRKERRRAEAQLRALDFEGATIGDDDKCLHCKIWHTIKKFNDRHAP
jgi:hypothetical protein